MNYLQRRQSQRFSNIDADTVEGIIIVQYIDYDNYNDDRDNGDDDDDVDLCVSLCIQCMFYNNTL